VTALDDSPEATGRKRHRLAAAKLDAALVLAELAVVLEHRARRAEGYGRRCVAVNG
jgi:hypothetical protein